LKIMKLSTTKLAKLRGVTPQTIRRWVAEGKYTAECTEGGHLRINYTPEVQVYLYARVSSKKQISSLGKQKELLQGAGYGECSEYVHDIGSGFNFKRRNFIKILESIMSGTPVKIVATTPDRLSRSGLTLIIKIIEFYGGEVVFLEDGDKTESFDTATLISFLTSFCNSQSGKRRSNRYKKDTGLPEQQTGDV